ncbi:aspartate/glutamate racemase family protein [Pseudosulfitobacter pseudonitzschiae]|nr:aspartate/glutamate racemase family protein [Pseudosulfitobacter pseudonitzschiae]
MRRLLGDAQLYVSRVPSDARVTRETLAEMAAHLGSAAALLPPAADLAAVAYGCTSGAAQIGPVQIARLVRQGRQVGAVTDPVSALVAACAHLGIRRLALLSPYVEAVSEQLRDVLAQQGVDTPVFGTFAEAEEAKVVRIAPEAIVDASMDLCAGAEVDGLFLSCTNLRTLPVIDRLETALDLPVLSSNLVLAWHMAQLASVRVAGPGRFLATA